MNFKNLSLMKVLVYFTGYIKKARSLMKYLGLDKVYRFGFRSLHTWFGYQINPFYCLMNQKYSFIQKNNTT